MFRMMLIDSPLPEFVVVSEVADMSHCSGVRCVLFELGILKSLLQLLFVVVEFQLLYSNISAGNCVEPGSFKAYWAESVLDFLLLCFKKLGLALYSFTVSVFLWVVWAVWPCFNKLSVWFHREQWNSVWMPALQCQKSSTWMSLQPPIILLLDMTFHLPSDQRKIIIQGKHK